MARRPRPAADETTVAAETPAPLESAPVATETPVRRRRRRRTVDQAAQSALLIDALLKARGTVGATTAQILAVTTWAQDIHAEAAELASLSTRVRRRKAELTPERQAGALLNQHLLESVLSGRYSLNVDDAGSLIFAQGSEVSGG